MILDANQTLLSRHRIHHSFIAMTPMTRRTIYTAFIISAIIIFMNMMLFAKLRNPHHQSTKYYSIWPLNSFGRINVDEHAADIAERDLFFSNRGGCGNNTGKQAMEIYNSMNEIMHMCGNGNDTSLTRSGTMRNVYSFKNNETQNPLFLHRMPEFDVKTTTKLYENIPSSTTGGVVTMRDAYVGGEYGHAYDCQSVFFPGGCMAWTAQGKFPHNLLEQQQPLRIDDAVLLFQYWGWGYFHWFMEDFFRIGIVYEFLLANPNVKLISYPIANGKDFFDLIGLEYDKRVVPYQFNQLYHVHRLLIPTATSCGRAQRPAVTRLRHVIRSKLLETFPDLKVNVNYVKNSTKQCPEMLNTGDSPSIVLQHRGDGKSRSLSNHQELLMKLKTEFPCHKVVEFLQNENLWQAAQKHFHARLIVGPHGAGLSNVVFSNNSTVIEIHPDQGNGPDALHHVNYCHTHTALISGSKHILVIADNGNALSVFKAPLDIVLQHAHQVLD